MIRVTGSTAALAQRLGARAGLLAKRLAAARRKRGGGRGSDWHSAATLWPDFTGDQADGK